jgi:uncharacterized protein (DUF1501 family)
MRRRDFLKAGAVFSLSLLSPELAGWAYSGNKQLEGKKLIVVFLRGAVDGLNVVAPYGDKNYYQARPTIAIAQPGQKDGLLDLDSYWGMAPALAPLMPYWQDKSLAFVQACGSPEATRSHFDAQDYMESGRPGVKVSGSGWLNRVLTELPDTKSPLRGINVGSTLPRILQGPVDIASYAPQTAGKKSAIDAPMVASAFSKMYANRTDALGKAYAEGIKANEMLGEKLKSEMVAADKGAPSAKSFKGFGHQLGKIFVDDPQIQVAFVALGGFDTHINQGAGKGQLANHLTGLGTGLADLIEALGSDYKNTIIMVMSEFGRTVKENGNGGTDHGHGNVMWLLGGNIQGGKVYGKVAGLDDDDLYERRDLPVNTDFRTVISTVSQAHLKLATKSIGEVFPNFALSDKSVSDIVKG